MVRERGRNRSLKPLRTSGGAGNARSTKEVGGPTGGGAAGPPRGPFGTHRSGTAARAGSPPLWSPA
eukprot:6724037-Lingulodinium_polyedra.AAC.1